ncbi:MAG: MarR family transcriptional regulator [Burkholderiales bacterium]|nr:MarR family transcriptional regulator [Burkholderiales bacterium]
MLQSNIFREIDNLSKHINIIYEKIFKKYGLQRGQFAFITRIVENKNINLKQLAQNIRVDKATVTKAMQKLEESGYVIKKIDQTDNRIIHLLPTEKCTRIYTCIIQEKNQLLSSIINKFTSEELELYISITRDINICLDKIR